MKNIWRDYWKGQTYNASALNMGMFLVKTSPCCYAKHPDVLTDNIRVFFTLDFMAI